MAKSNCPAEDSAPPQASAGQLTPRFLPLSLSGRLLQVTVAISPPAAKGASKGRFSARIRSEGPRSQMQDFETRTRGELRRRSRKFYQTEGDADFREKVSRSIWHSELRLSTCDRILPARRILSFGGDSRLVVCFCWLGKGSLLPEKPPFHCVCKRCICRGSFRLEQNQKTAKRLFRKPFSAGIWVVEVTSE